MIHPLTGGCRPTTGIKLEEALVESAKQSKVACKGHIADTLWKVMSATCTYVQAGQPSVTATTLSHALPAIHKTTCTYVQGLCKSPVAKATRKRPRRPAGAGGGDAPLLEGAVPGQAAGVAKRPRAGAEGSSQGAPAGRHAAPARKPSAVGSTAVRPSENPLRRLQARRMAELMNRPDWDTDAAEKFAGLVRQPAEDQLLVAQSVLHLVTRDKNVSSSGCLAHVPQFVEWMSSALEARLYGVIDVLCKTLLRFNADSIYAVCCTFVLAMMLSLSPADRPLEECACCSLASSAGASEWEPAIGGYMKCCGHPRACLDL